MSFYLFIYLFLLRHINSQELACCIFFDLKSCLVSHQESAAKSDPSWMEPSTEIKVQLN